MARDRIAQGLETANPGTSPAMPDVVLPVLNEREALPWVLERMPAGYEPIVVDNGSTDGSGALAASLGARVVTEPQPGFGAACFAGTRVTVQTLFDHLEAGYTIDGFLEQFPTVRREQVVQLLDYPAFFTLHKSPLPENRSSIIDTLEGARLIRHNVEDQ
jgi:uncharacterized protein (DUF433 family)